MAITTIKTTYALDVQTVVKLEQLAKEWGVSKSEALRRAIQASSEARRTEDSSRAVTALNNLQSRIQLDSKQAGRWIRAARSERRAASAKRTR